MGVFQGCSELNFSSVLLRTWDRPVKGNSPYCRNATVCALAISSSKGDQTGPPRRNQTLVTEFLTWPDSLHADKIFLQPWTTP